MEQQMDKLIEGAQINADSEIKPPVKRKLFEKYYDGESIIDLERDVQELQGLVCRSSIPRDKHGIHKGVFKVLIEWVDDDSGMAYDE